MKETQNMEILGKLFSSDAIVKVMRLFLMNPKQVFDTEEISERSRITEQSAKTEINILKNIGFVKSRPFTKTKKVVDKLDRERIYKKKTTGWVLNDKFAYAEPLGNLLIDSELIHAKEIAKKLKRAGQIRLLVLSGLFTKDVERSLDLLIVGDNLSKVKLTTAVQQIEAEVGKELRYAMFTTEEFKYRLDMYDKLVRDVFDNHYQVVIDTLKGKYD